MLLQNWTLVFLLAGFLLSEKHLISRKRPSASMKKSQVPRGVFILYHVQIIHSFPSAFLIMYRVRQNESLTCFQEKQMQFSATEMHPECTKSKFLFLDKLNRAEPTRFLNRSCKHLNITPCSAKARFVFE